MVSLMSLLLGIPVRNLEGKGSSREFPRVPQGVPLGNLGITEVTEVQEITDARFGKRKGCALIRKSRMHVLARGKAVL